MNDIEYLESLARRSRNWEKLREWVKLRIEHYAAYEHEAEMELAIMESAMEFVLAKMDELDALNVTIQRLVELNSTT